VTPRTTQTSIDESSPLETLDDIPQLISESGDPDETLRNVVASIHRRFATDVSSVYLLEADRMTLVLAATIGLRPESVGRVRMRITEGLAGLVAERLQPEVVADAARHPRFKYFSEAGEDAYRSFLGVPVVDRGLLQGVLVLQTRDPREFSAEDVRLLTIAGAELAPILAEARTLGQLIAPAHERLSALSRNLWWTWDNDATSLFREIDPIRWRELGHNPVALLHDIPIDKIEERASDLALHSRINYAFRRMQEYLHSRHTWGARHAGVLRPRPVAYFSAELLRWTWHSCRRSHQECFRSRYPAGRRRSLLRPGLLQAAARLGRLAARRLHRRRQPHAPDRSGDDSRRSRRRPDRNADRHNCGASVDSRGRAQHAVAAGFECRR
jgi:glycogen phosphorylase